MNTTNEIGTIISSLRKEAGWSQKEMAEKLFVSPSTVSKWENGDATPDIHRVKEIAQIFQVSVLDLIGETAKNRTDKQNDEWLQAEKGTEECIIDNVTEEHCCKEDAKLIDVNSFKKKYSRKKIWLGAFIGVLLISFLCLWLKNYHKDNTYGSVEFEIVDEFLDETSKHWGYESIYHVVVEFEGELNVQQQKDFTEYVRDKYNYTFEKAEVIKVSFIEDYNDKEEVYTAKFHAFLLKRAE